MIPEEYVEACSTNLAYRELKGNPKGESMQRLYNKLKELLKSYYTEPKDAMYGFEDPDNKKHCWITERVDYKALMLDWGEAVTVLQAVYADYPLFFFSDLYRTGGNPENGYICPVIDSECARGVFRRFYAEMIEEEIKKSISSIAITATSRREAAKRIYNYIGAKAKYDNNKGNGRFTGYVDVPSHSILNYVRNRSAVCEGFSRTYQAFMNYISIPTISESVMSLENNHMCNFVYLADEKKWIMVDVTLEAILHDNSGFDMFSHKYRRIKKEDLKNSEYFVYSPKYDCIWNEFLREADF